MEKISRYLKISNSSCFILGPRGTGKSTFIHDKFPEAQYIDFLQPDIYRSYLARPERLREVVLGSINQIFILDEVQKIPEILSVVHSLIEERKGLQFILTGSSARKLKKSAVNLLAGRALMYHMHPFMAAEMGSHFSLGDSLIKGLLPVVWGSNSPLEALQAYIDLYLREEVKMEGLTRNIGNFSRFLEAISFSHAAVLNISNVARDCQIERKVVEGYVEILEDLLLSFRVPTFTKRAKRKPSLHPKFYFFDAGVFRAIRPSGPLDKTSEIDGVALEGLVAQHLRAWIDYFDPRAQLFFWRTSSGNEVDFIVYGENVFWSIEVKNSKQIRPQDLRGLKEFGKDYPEAKKILLYRGEEKLLIEDIQIQPCVDFLKNLGLKKNIT